MDKYRVIYVLKDIHSDKSTILDTVDLLEVLPSIKSYIVVENKALFVDTIHSAIDKNNNPYFLIYCYYADQERICNFKVFNEEIENSIVNKFRALERKDKIENLEK